MRSGTKKEFYRPLEITLKNKNNVFFDKICVYHVFDHECTTLGSIGALCPRF